MDLTRYEQVIIPGVQLGPVLMLNHRYPKDLTGPYGQKEEKQKKKEIEAALEKQKGPTPETINEVMRHPKPLERKGADPELAQRKKDWKEQPLTF
jgi:hypothetical protein